MIMQRCGLGGTLRGLPVGNLSVFADFSKLPVIMERGGGGESAAGARYDQDLRFGAGNVRGAFWVVDTLEAGGYDGPVHFDYKPPRTEDDEGVWASAAACMRNYLILRAKVRAFRADPEVAEALRLSGVDQLRSPTLAPGETWRDVRDATADADALGRRGLGYEYLDQLALEYLYGVR
jgi:xylose isomerase